MNNISKNTIEPSIELGAYEAIWDKSGIWFKALAEMFAKNDRPSSFVSNDTAISYFKLVKEIIDKNRLEKFGVQIKGTLDYPKKLEDAAEPLQLLYYNGIWDLIFTPSVAIVGARKASDLGLKRARKIAKGLVDKGYTVVSGLAEGVDTAAHTAAIEANGKTIGVIGTPLSHVYPKTNKELMEKITKNHLIVSQVPFIRYEHQNYHHNRLFFLERNKTMSALTQATIIVEASDTSGSLVQAKAALQQKRKLFILQSCFEKGLKWPENFERQGAIRVKEFADILENLNVPAEID